jgi:hypothetical protein
MNSVVNEHLVKSNRFLRQIGDLSTQINAFITKPGYSETTMVDPELFVITEFDCTSQHGFETWANKKNFIFRPLAIKGSIL